LQVEKLSDFDINTLNSFYTNVIKKITLPTLSRFVNDQINFLSATTLVTKIDQLSNVVPNQKSITEEVGVHINCKGDISLGLLFHMDSEISQHLLSNSTPYTSILNKLSFFTELGHVLASSIFNYINFRFGYKTTPSTPVFAQDDFYSLLEFSITENIRDESLLCHFAKMKSQIRGYDLSLSVFQNVSDAKRFL